MSISLPHVSLRDEMVQLRGWRADDLSALYTAFSDPAVQRFFWHLDRPFTEADAQAALSAELESHARNTELQRGHPPRSCPTRVEFAVATPDAQDVLLGGAAIHDIDQDQGQAAVGYWLAPHARGRGIATRSVQLLVNWAFTTLELARLELECSPDNVASQRVAERCGFVREGLVRSHWPFKGGMQDVFMFSLLPKRAAARTMPSHLAVPTATDPDLS